jgi:hypothetical protein
VLRQGGSQRVVRRWRSGLVTLIGHDSIVFVVVSFLGREFHVLIEDSQDLAWMGVNERWFAFGTGTVELCLISPEAFLQPCI